MDLCLALMGDWAELALPRFLAGSKSVPVNMKRREYMYTFLEINGAISVIN